MLLVQTGILNQEPFCFRKEGFHSLLNLLAQGLAKDRGEDLSFDQPTKRVTSALNFSGSSQGGEWPLSSNSTKLLSGMFSRM